MSLADRHAQALELTRAAGAELLLCSDPANVHWLSGVATEIETGPSPFAPAPVFVLGDFDDGGGRLIAAAEDLPDTLPPEVVAVAYEGFTMGPLRGQELFDAALAEVLDGRTVIADDCDGLAGPLLDARAVKDALALEGLRAALAVTDAGQAALRAAAADAAGRSELELFAVVRAALEQAAGARVPVLADLVSGPRTAAAGGPPSERIVGAGELILCDLAPRVGGSWGDSCATVAVGEPSAAARVAHRRVHDALQRAIEAVRPGADAAAIDALARAGLDYPHHTGHGIGSSYHERPRLIPQASSSLREGMVLALEPALYADDFGIRLEHVVRVTADGCEVLSRHRLELQ
jgi:Xaa-Pro aminopeptidase